MTRKKGQKSLVVPHFLVPCSHKYHPVARVVQYFFISSQSRSFSFISTSSFVIICFFYQFHAITQLFFLFTQSYNKKPSTQSRHHTHMTYLTFHIDNTLTLRDRSNLQGGFLLVVVFWQSVGGGTLRSAFSILRVMIQKKVKRYQWSPTKFTGAYSHKCWVVPNYEEQDLVTGW